MTHCPKCGSGDIAGPRYVRDAYGYGVEVLRYFCGRCGYWQDAPTLDAARVREAKKIVEGRSCR